MTDERPGWAMRLAQERALRGWSQKAMAARLRAAATAAEQARLPSPDSLRRYIRDYEAGRHFPRDYAGLYSRVFAMTQAQLFGDAAYPAASPAPAASACDAASLAAWMESTNTSDDALAYLAEAAESLAESHPVLAPRDALERVLEVHGRAHSLLQGKQQLGQRRALFGIQAELLAHVCLLLGDLQETSVAARYGDLAEAAATEGGASPACAFSARAQVARWQNRYAEAAVLAAAGWDVCPSATLRALLACQEANAAALAGDRRRALAALDRAVSGWCPATESAWSLPESRFAAYRVSVFLHLGDPASAVREAQDADADPPRSAATRAHLLVSLALAHLMLGSAEAAASAVEPVFAVPGEYRVATVVSHLAAMDRLLRRRRFSGSATALHVRERIRDFTASSLAPAAGQP
jgi:transcriptional regulator with XRE-family HTH domain